MALIAYSLALERNAHPMRERARRKDRNLRDQARLDLLPAAPWNSRRSAQVWGFIEALLAAPGLRMLTEGSDHARVVQSRLAGLATLRGNLWHDAHIVALMHEHGITRVYTRDIDFHHFAGIEVSIR